MAFDEGLATRLREYFEDKPDYTERKMFGGLCFMLSEHMTCGIVGDTLMARVGPDNYEACLSRPHAKEMDFTGRPMKGMVYVSAEGIEEEEDLEGWVNTCESFVRTLPPK